MKVFKITLILLTALFFVACNSEKKKLKQKIDALEAKTGKPDAEMATAKAGLYEEYANKFKDDTLAPIYLYKAAEIYELTANYNRSIELYTVFDERYPKHRLAPEALYHKGIEYETGLQDFPRAKQAYEELIQRFPKHQCAIVAQQNLPFVGTVPDFAKELLEGKTVTDSVSDTN